MTTLKIENNQFKILDESAQKLDLSVSDLVKLCASYLTMEKLPKIDLNEFKSDFSKNIVSDFTATGKYSETFLNELEEALDESVFNKAK